MYIIETRILERISGKYLTIELFERQKNISNHTKCKYKVWKR